MPAADTSLTKRQHLHSVCRCRPKAQAYYLATMSVEKGECWILPFHTLVKLTNDDSVEAQFHESCASPREYMLQHSPGAYTCCRPTVDFRLSMQQFHLDRLEHSTLDLIAHNKVSLTTVQGTGNSANSTTKKLQISSQHFDNVKNELGSLLHRRIEAIRLKLVEGVESAKFDPPLTDLLFSFYVGPSQTNPQELMLGFHMCHMEVPYREPVAIQIVSSTMRELPETKATSWITERIPLEQCSVASNTQEVVMVHDNRVLEGLKCNIFFILRDEQGRLKISTAPSGILMGSTRAAVISACKLMNVPVFEEFVSLNDDLASRLIGAFTTSAIRLLTPVSRIVHADGGQAVMQFSDAALELVNRIRNVVLSEFIPQQVVLTTCKQESAQ